MPAKAKSSASKYDWWYWSTTVALCHPSPVPISGALLFHGNNGRSILVHSRKQFTKSKKALKFSSDLRVFTVNSATDCPSAVDMDCFPLQCSTQVVRIFMLCCNPNSKKVVICVSTHQWFYPSHQDQAVSQGTHPIIVWHSNHTSVRGEH